MRSCNLHHQILDFQAEHVIGVDPSTDRFQRGPAVFSYPTKIFLRTRNMTGLVLHRRAGEQNPPKIKKSIRQNPVDKPASHFRSLHREYNRNPNPTPVRVAEKKIEKGPAPRFPATATAKDQCGGAEMADAIEDVDAKSGAVKTAKDLFSGAAGGIAQVLLGS
jgi:hypothetical protein